MAKVLTQLIVERFKPPKSGRVVHWDALFPGFGLRITDKSSRSWIAMYRVKGKAVMQTLGSLALIPKVDDARQHAREAIASDGAVQLGGQPGSRLHQSDRRCTAPRQGGAARPAARR